MIKKTKLKKTEIGLIPEDWEIKRLDEVTTKITDGAHHSPKTTKNGKLIATVKDMTNSGFNLKTCREISEKDFNKLVKGDCKPEKNDLLIAKDGSYLKHVFVSSGEDDIVILSSIAIIRPDIKIISPEFLKYTIFNPITKNRVASNYVSGAVIPRIILKDFKKIKITLPSLREQKSIVKIFSDLDSKIELLQKQNETLENIGKTIFKHWFVDFEFPNKKGKPYKSSGGKMVESEMGKIPERWKVLKMEEIVKKKKHSIVDGPFGTQLHSNEYVNCGIPVIRVINTSFEGRFLKENLVYIKEEKFNELIRSAVYPGEILLAKTGATIGKFSKLPNNISKALVASSILKISPNEFNKNFLYNIIKKLSDNNYWGKISAGSTRPTINLSDVRNIRLIYPDEQILKKYNIIIEDIYLKKENNESNIDELTKTRDLLLPKLMTGKIRVPLEDKK